MDFHRRVLLRRQRRLSMAAPYARAAVRVAIVRVDDCVFLKGAFVLGGRALVARAAEPDAQADKEDGGSGYADADASLGPGGEAGGSLWRWGWGGL